MPRDVFLSTQGTWIGARLQEGAGGRDAVNRHLMEVYREPLVVYYKGMARGGIGDPEEVVQGFFADRLAREEFLADWQKSGLPLRRWLMNAFCFHLRERHRRDRRDGRVVACDEIEEALDEGAPAPETLLDRTYAVSITRRALMLTGAACKSAGLQVHWKIFVEHHLEDRPYPDLARELHVTPERASVMARTVRRRFVKVFRELLDKEGVPPERVDAEIESLLEVIAS